MQLEGIMPQAAYVESEVINVKYYICNTCNRSRDKPRISYPPSCVIRTFEYTNKECPRASECTLTGHQPFHWCILATVCSTAPMYVGTTTIDFAIGAAGFVQFFLLSTAFSCCTDCI